MSVLEKVAWFLRKPRIRNASRERAMKSMFVWGPESFEWHEEHQKYRGMRYLDIPELRWYLSILGIMNGFFGLVGLRIHIMYPDDKWEKPESIKIIRVKKASR